MIATENRRPRITVRRRPPANKAVRGFNDLPDEATCEHCKKPIRYTRQIGDYFHPDTGIAECGLIKNANDEVFDVPEGHFIVHGGIRVLRAEPDIWYYDA
jgi:hypothetical protein